MSTNIYILKLQGDRYYIGKSNDVMKRYGEHLSGKGSAWTQKYKPIGVEKIIEKASPFDEDKYVKEYMSKYGMDKVRGGTYVSVELDEFQKQMLNEEIWGAQDKCTNCGRKGHFIKDCYASTDVRGNSLEEEVWCCDNCHKEFEDQEDCEKHERFCKKSSSKCFNCGKYGHWANNCWYRR
jgi:predicted GIY-YIG superfamily endonuclease